MKSIIIAGAVVLSLTACNSVTNQQGGAVVGGVAGGVLGNTIGGGSGNTAATIGGAIIGTIVGSSVGQNMDKQQQTPQVIVQQPQPVPMHPQYKNYPADACSRYIGNEGAYASCQRGVAQRNAEIQQQLEREAYQAGKGQ
jgi:uncharacterized protein YcfJ